MMFHKRGGHFMVDGQFGSTGKGLLAAWVATKYGTSFDLAVTNSGPNSGHTSYIGDRKIVLKQLPTLPVIHKYLKREIIPIYLSAGAVINLDILNAEVEEHGVKAFVSARAALVTEADKEAEGSGSIAQVAGTRQGVGHAIARKVMRDPLAIVGRVAPEHWHPNIKVVEWEPDYRGAVVWFEVAQGFSLGLNSHFYPKVTSRECTVMQAAADARFPAQHVRSCSLVIRTFPIRVSNFEGHSSGDCYSDQHETTWEAIGVEPELTTVTKRERRVFTFSMVQYEEAIYANQPDLIFVNFMNYLPKDKRLDFARNLQDHAKSVLNRSPNFRWGYGPKPGDVYEDPRGPDAENVNKPAA